MPIKCGHCEEPGQHRDVATVQQCAVDHGFKRRMSRFSRSTVDRPDSSGSSPEPEPSGQGAEGDFQPVRGLPTTNLPDEEHPPPSPPPDPRSHSSRTPALPEDLPPRELSRLAPDDPVPPEDDVSKWFAPDGYSFDDTRTSRPGANWEEPDSEDAEELN